MAPEVSETIPVTVALSPWAKALAVRRHSSRELVKNRIGIPGV